MKLPPPSPEAQAFTDALQQDIANEIRSAGGWIGFDRFMARALYSPGKGYYSGGAQKFGAAGDFVTAPELSPVFGATLATQAAQVMQRSAPQILEVGAGSGRLAVDLLEELERRGALPERYAILELSGELRARQRTAIRNALPHLLERVEWLDAQPARFDGLIVANELLDAIPVHLVYWDETSILERGVARENGEFVWRDRPASGRLLQRAQALADEFELPVGYLSEIGLAAADWTASWGTILGCGVLLLIDYGFPRHEYYHAQRDRGTLMCHYRHHAHEEPFFLPGLQDITAHVDFTAIVESGYEAGLDVLGYASQASFLVNCGLADIAARVPFEDSERYLRQAQAIQKLLSPAEMGELFKVLALGKGVDVPLAGFASGDRTETL